MPIFLTRGRIAAVTVLCFLCAFLLAEPFVLPWIVEKVPFGTWIAAKGIERAESIGYRANSVILSGLTSESISVVRTAIKSAQRRTLTSAVPLLFKLVNIGDVTTAKMSVDALCSITGQPSLAKELDPEKRKIVRDLVDDVISSEFGGKIAAYKLEDVGISAVPVITDKLHSMIDAKSHKGSITLLVSLLSKAGGGFRPELIISYLQKPCSEDLRGALENALASLGEDVVPLLEREIRSGEYRRFGSAVNVLLKVDPQLTAVYLSSLITRGIELSASKRKRIYQILKECPSKETYEGLRQAITFESEGKMRVLAIEAMEKCTSDGVVPFLLRLTQDADRNIRKAAYKALYRNGSPRAHKALAEKYVSEPFYTPDSREIDSVLSSDRSGENQ